MVTKTSILPAERTAFERAHKLLYSGVTLLDHGDRAAVDTLLASVNMFSEINHKHAAMEFYFKALRAFSAEPSPEYRADYERWSSTRNA